MDRFNDDLVPNGFNVDAAGRFTNLVVRSGSEVRNKFKWIDLQPDGTLILQDGTVITGAASFPTASQGKTLLGAHWAYSSVAAVPALTNFVLLDAGLTPVTSLAAPVIGGVLRVSKTSQNGLVSTLALVSEGQALGFRRETGGAAPDQLVVCIASGSTVDGGTYWQIPLTSALIPVVGMGTDLTTGQNYEGGLLPPFQLEELTDVDLTPPLTAGQVLTYDGTKWVNGSAGAASYAALTDVDVAGVTDGSVSCVWDQTAGKFVDVPEIKVIPASRDVMVSTTGTGSVHSDGPLSLSTQSLLSASTPGNMVLQSTGAGVTLQGTSVVSIDCANNINVTAEGSAVFQAIAPVGDVTVRAATTTLVEAQSTLQLRSVAADVKVNADTNIDIESTGGEIQIRTVAPSVQGLTVSTEGSIIMGSQNGEIIAQSQLDANLQSNGGLVSLNAVAGQVRTVAPVFDVQNETLTVSAIRYDATAGTVRTAIPSYEAAMVDTSFATKKYVDDADTAKNYATLADVDVTGVVDGAVSCVWDQAAGKFKDAPELQIATVSRNITASTTGSVSLQTSGVGGVVSLGAVSGQVNASAPVFEVFNGAQTVSAIRYDATAGTVRTAIPAYEAAMVPTSFATKAYVDSVPVPANVVVDGGNTIASGNLEVGTNSNNNLILRAFGQDKFIIQNTVGTATMTSNLPVSIGTFATASGPTVTVSGGFKNSAGGVGGNLILAAGGTLGGAAVNSADVQIQGSSGLGFVLTGSTGLLSSNVAGYESLVTVAGAMTNKAYVDAAIAAGIAASNISDLSTFNPAASVSPLTVAATGVTNVSYFAKIIRCRATVAIPSGRIVSFTGGAANPIEVTFVNGGTGEQNASAAPIGVTLADVAAGGTVSICIRGICSVLNGSVAGTGNRGGTIICEGGSTGRTQAPGLAVGADEAVIGVCMTNGAIAAGAPFLIAVRQSFENF